MQDLAIGEPKLFRFASQLFGPEKPLWVANRLGQLVRAYGPIALYVDIQPWDIESAQAAVALMPEGLREKVALISRIPGASPGGTRHERRTETEGAG